MLSSQLKYVCMCFGFFVWLLTRLRWYW